MCETCNTNYYKITENGTDVCKTCSYPCATCISLDKCETCVSGANLIQFENTCKKCHEWMFNCLECNVHNVCIKTCNPD